MAGTLVGKSVGVEAFAADATRGSVSAPPPPPVESPSSRETQQQTPDFRSRRSGSVRVGIFKGFIWREREMKQTQISHPKREAGRRPWERRRCTWFHHAVLAGSIGGRQAGGQATGGRRDGGEGKTGNLCHHGKTQEVSSLQARGSASHLRADGSGGRGRGNGLRAPEEL